MMLGKLWQILGYGKQENRDGLVCLAQGKSLEALEHFYKAYKYEPINSIFLSNAAVAISAMGQTKEALQMYEAAIKINPHWIIYKNMAILCFTLKDYEKMLLSSNEALKLNPSCSVAMHAKLTALMLLERCPEGIEYAKELQEKFPRNTEEDLKLFHYCLVVMAAIYRRVGQYSMALKIYDQVIELFPKSYLGHNGRANILLWTGHYEESMLSFQKAKEMEMTELDKQAIINTKIICPKYLLAEEGINTLQLKLAEYSNPVTETKAILEDQKSAIEERDQVIQDVCRDSERLCKQIKELEATIERLVSEKQELKDLHEQGRTKTDNMSKQINDLTQEKNKLEQELKKLRTEKSQFKNNLALQTQIFNNKLAEEKEKHKKELKKQEEKYQEKIFSYEKLRQQLQGKGKIDQHPKKDRTMLPFPLNTTPLPSFSFTTSATVSGGSKEITSVASDQVTINISPGNPTPQATTKTESAVMSNASTQGQANNLLQPK